MSTRKYPIKHLAVYFGAGRAPSRGYQVLIGRQFDQILCLFFDASGEYERYETKAVAAASSDQVVSSSIAAWMVELGVVPSTIHVGKFYIPDQTIGIRDLPNYVQSFADDPSSEPTEERELMVASLSAWRDRGKFVLVWDEEYEMTADGEVEST